MAAPLPEAVRGVVDRYLSAVGAQVEALYLVGSVALGDFRPAVSDVDFVAVVGRPLLPPEHDALGRVHASVRAARPRPSLNGIYVTWDDLRRSSQLAGTVSFHFDGRFERAAGGDANPVVWLTLRDHGVSARGPDPGMVGIWHDPAELRRWALATLDTHWRPWVRHARSRAGRRAAAPDLADAVLGVLRPHFTVATGGVTSKEGAGVDALARFPPRWHPVVEAALRLRRGQPGPRQDRDDAVAFVDLVIDDAVRR